MLLRPSYVIHSHYAGPLDITDRVVSGTWTRSVAAPFESGNFTFKLSYQEIGTIVNPGDWLVATDPAGFPYTFLHIDRVNYGVNTSAIGAVTMFGTVNCSSWMSLLSKTALYVPKGDTESRGTLLSFLDWAKLNGSLINDYFVGPIGKALQAFHQGVARIRLPESLGGGFLGDDIPVVYDDETLGSYAPDRIIDKIDKVSGLPNYLSFNFYTGNVLEAYFRTWVPEPMLIDLYPSIEHGGTAPMSPLAQAINGRPVLIYTMKPWRSEPLYDAQTSYTTFNDIDDTVNSWRPQVGSDPYQAFMGGVLGPSFSGVGRALKQAKDLQDKSLDAKRAFALSSSFTDITMDPARMKRIPSTSVRDIVMSYSDDDRINVSSISLTPADNTGIEALPEAGLPLTNDESIWNHGARVVKPSWPFIPPINPNTTFAGDVGDYLYAIAAQLMQFHVNSHKHATGTLRTDPLDAIIDRDKEPTPKNLQQKHRYVHLQAGEWFKTTFREGLDDFYGYATTVTHEWGTSATGANSFNCTVAYTRGVSASDKLTIDGKVPVGDDNKPRAGLRSAPLSSQSEPIIPLTVDFEYSAWTGAIAFTYPESTISLARKFNLDALDVFVNDNDNEKGTLYGNNGEEIPGVVDKLRSSGFKVYLTSWVRPTDDFMVNLKRFAQIAQTTACDGISLDVEEPWVLAVKNMSEAKREEWSQRAMDTVRAHFTGDVGTTFIIDADAGTKPYVEGLLKRGDFCVPQAYATVKNTRGVGPPGRLEKRAADFSKYAPVYVGLWGQANGLEGAYGLPAEEAAGQSALAAYNNITTKGVRYWRLETLWNIQAGYNAGRALINSSGARR